MKIRHFIFLLMTTGVLLYSCAPYKQHRMFETEVAYKNDTIQTLLQNKEKHFILRADDYIMVNVYNSAGEVLIDPDQQLGTGISTTSGSGTGSTVVNKDQKYLIRSDGKVTLPMLGDVHVGGLTLHQCDSLLSNDQTGYGKYYNKPFVITKVVNKRVIVFGPEGAKVIPLENQHISVIEVMALYGQLRTNWKSHNIRLIRGNLKNPDVQIINLRTIDGMKQASLDILPGDILYLEPQRKIFSETLNDILPVVSAFTSILTVILFIAVNAKN